MKLREPTRYQLWLALVVIIGAMWLSLYHTILGNRARLLTSAEFATSITEAVAKGASHRESLQAIAERNVAAIERLQKDVTDLRGMIGRRLLDVQAGDQ